MRIHVVLWHLGPYTSDLTNEKFLRLTDKQLTDWGVKYHKPFMGKPAGNISADDKAQNDMDFFKQFS